MQRFFRGLEGGDDGGFGGLGRLCSFLCFFPIALDHAVDQLGDGAFACSVFGDLGSWGEDAECGVDGDLFYGFAFGAGFGRGLGFAEVEAGDLEAVEEEAGAAWVDVVGGDALEDLADGKLNAGAIVGIGERQVEGGAAAAALAWVGYRLAGGVVVVAELFLAEAWTGAAASVGEDVAALVLFGCFGCVLHVVLPTGTFFVQSLRKRRDESGLAMAQVFSSRRD